jgi:hypothetical protein
MTHDERNRVSFAVLIAVLAILGGIGILLGLL